MILDMFKKKNNAKKQEAEPAKAPAAEEKREKTPDELMQEAQIAKAKQRLEKLERLIRQMHADKKDCYLVLDPRTTLEELATKERVRPLISPLSPQQRLPVLRFATTEAVAGDIAKAFGCVCEERPLVLKVPFMNLFRLMNNLARAGIFLYTVTDGPDTYVDQIAHLGYYVYNNLMEKDAKGYLQYMSVLESLHALRVTRMPFYVLPAPNATAEDLEKKTFQIGLIGQEKNMMCPVFGTRQIAEQAMKNLGVEQTLIPLSAQETMDKLQDLKTRCQGNDFPIFFGGIKGAEVISADRFVELVNELFLAQPQPTEQNQTTSDDEVSETEPQADEEN